MKSTFENRLLNIRVSVSLCLLACLVSFGCNPASDPVGPAQPDQSFRVAAASYPLQYLTQRIAGEKVNVEFPVDSKSDPRSWSPTVEQIQDLQAADLVVVNGPGAAYAKWLVRVSLLPSKVCNSVDDLDIAEYFMVNDYQIVHTHGPEGDHSHAYMVPYPWLDPAIAKKQATKIAAALARTYPEFKSEFSANLATLHADLDALIDEFNSAQLSGTVVTANPDAKYLTRALGFDDQHLLLFDFEKTTQADAMTRIKQLGEIEIAKLVWVDSIGSAFDDQAVAKFRSLFGGVSPPVVEVNLLDHPPANGDYLSAMRELLNNFK